MDNYQSLKEEMLMPDYRFPMKINAPSKVKKNNLLFHNHWHRHLELLYFCSGKALIYVNSQSYLIKSGDLIVVNSNELHSGKCLSDDLIYYTIIFDPSLLQSQSVDLCEQKYMVPILQNRILFNNKITNDSKINGCIENILTEYESREMGYELQIKADLYHFIVLLLRHYTQAYLSESDYAKRELNFERINPILNYIENNYTSKIAVDDLAKKANLSKYYFCRVFKEITGRSPNEYINYMKINRAEQLLKYHHFNVTEAALEVGFTDLNYFSRTFKKYKNISPSLIIKKNNT